MAKLRKTSLQLPPTLLHEMSRCPGLNRSEALRLWIERGQYLAGINSANVAHIAEEYAPILRAALEDLDYDDYRVVVRSLPQMVAGFFGEVLSERSDGRSWRSEVHDHELDPNELVKKLEN